MERSIEYIPAYLPKGKYLYGIIRGGGDRKLGPVGLKKALVYTIDFKDIAALVSNHPLTKIKPLREDLASHHRVIKDALKKFTVIPMAFGHVVRSAKEIRKVLESNYPRIDLELDRLNNKVEMGLRIVWDVDSIFEYFVNGDRELRDFGDTIFGRSRQPSHHEKIDLGRLFESKLNKERERHSETVVKALGNCTVDARVHLPANEKMVMNGVFLIEKGKERLFEEGVHRVAALFDGNFTFDYSGPWAPHNFVELRLDELGLDPSPQESKGRLRRVL